MNSVEIDFNSLIMLALTLGLERRALLLRPLPRQLKVEKVYGLTQSLVIMNN